MQAAEKVQLAAAEQRADSQVRSALETQLEQLRSTHATQLAALRDELAANQRQLQELKELVLQHIRCQGSVVFVGKRLTLCFSLTARTRS